jgi:hypothetical protein
MARLRLDRDRAAVVLLDDPARHVESKAGTLADVLRGEEGLERAGGDFRWHARSGVGDLNLHAIEGASAILARRARMAARRLLEPLTPVLTRSERKALQ